MKHELVLEFKKQYKKFINQLIKISISDKDARKYLNYLGDCKTNIIILRFMRETSKIFDDIMLCNPSLFDNTEQSVKLSDSFDLISYVRINKLNKKNLNTVFIYLRSLFMMGYKIIDENINNVRNNSLFNDEWFSTIDGDNVGLLGAMENMRTNVKYPDGLKMDSDVLKQATNNIKNLLGDEGGSSDNMMMNMINEIGNSLDNPDVNDRPTEQDDDILNSLPPGLESLFPGNKDDLLPMLRAVSQVSNKYQQKIDEGELDPQELINQTQQMMGKMMGNINFPQEESS